jgi:hypothetical protein
MDANTPSHEFRILTFDQRHEQEAGRDDRQSNAERNFSQAFLPTLVGLSLTPTLGRVPRSLSPGVLWHSAGLA